MKKIDRNWIFSFFEKIPRKVPTEVTDLMDQFPNEFIDKSILWMEILTLKSPSKVSTLSGQQASGLAQQILECLSTSDGLKIFKEIWSTPFLFHRVKEVVKGVAHFSSLAFYGRAAGRDGLWRSCCHLWRERKNKWKTCVELKNFKINLKNNFFIQLLDISAYLYAFIKRLVEILQKLYFINFIKA